MSTLPLEIRQLFNFTHLFDEHFKAQQPLQGDFLYEKECASARPFQDMDAKQ